MAISSTKMEKFLTISLFTRTKINVVVILSSLVRTGMNSCMNKMQKRWKSSSLSL